MREPTYPAEMPLLPQDALQINLLGTFLVRSNGQIVPAAAWRLRKAQALVKVLALAPQLRLGREELFDLLWPDLDLDAARNNLRGVLFAARRALAPSGQILDQQQMLTLTAAGGVWVDWRVFEQATQAALGSHDRQQLQQALDLYRGDLLPEDHYEDWVLAPRERLRGLVLRLLHDLTVVQEAQGDAVAAITTLQRLVQLEPTTEEAHVRLVRLYAQVGQRSLAQRQWDTLVTTLARELAVTPDPASTAVYDAFLAGEFTPAGAASVSVESAPTPALPIPLTPLIGRDADVVVVRQLVAYERLVTLVGAGGCGKTRLALAVASGLTAEYRGSIWLVELAALTDPTLLMQTVASALGVRALPHQSLLAAVQARLAQAPALLVVDNAEHLRAACADLVQALLSFCPTLRLLVTSQVVLGVPGERSWRVPSLELPSLDLPTGGATTARQQLLNAQVSPAVQLFLERAQAQQPDFRLTEQNAALVSALVRRLEGIPLALELAAARVGLLPLSTLTARLDRSLMLLADQGRAGTARHRTMRATLDWSWALLTPPQQQLFTLSGLFAGGTTLPALEAVAGPVVGGRLLDDLGVLVAHSLVQAFDAGADRRYRLLEVAREYAAEQFATWPPADIAAAEQRFQDYYRDLIAAAASGLVGAQRQQWHDTLSAEQQNMRAFFARCVAAGDAERGFLAGYALWRWWCSRGEQGEGRQWLTQLLALVPAATAQAAPPWYSRGLFSLAWLIYEQGELLTAQAQAAQALAAAVQAQDADGIAAAEMLRCQTAFALGDYATAATASRAALAIRRQQQNSREVAVVLLSVARVALATGDWAATEATLQEALPIARVSGDAHMIALVLTRLAQVYSRLEQHDRAVILADEAVTLMQPLHEPQLRASVLVARAEVALRQGALVAARQWLRDSFGAMDASQQLLVLRNQLELVLPLAQSAGDDALVVELAGTLAGLHQHYGIQQFSPWLPEQNAAIAAARARLAPAAADAAWQRGLILHPADARAAVLAFLDQPPVTPR